MKYYYARKHIMPADHYIVSPFFNNEKDVIQWMASYNEYYTLHTIEIDSEET